MNRCLTELGGDLSNFNFGNLRFTFDINLPNRLFKLNFELSNNNQMIQMTKKRVPASQITMIDMY